MTAQDKRAAALGLVGECTDRLRGARQADDVRALASALAARAHALQGDPDDRPYFTRTMSRIAHVVRAHGWVDVAADTLEWTIRQGAVDGYVLSELAECQLARGDVDAAEATLARARASQVATDAIYTSLVKAHGRAGRPELARRMFEQARADRALTSFTYPALIAAYAVAGDLAGAHRAFESAQHDGFITPPAYTALASAYVGVGEVARVDAVLACARREGHSSSRLVLTTIRAHLEQRRFAVARRVLEETKALGEADGACYAVLIAACHKAGRHREAKRVFSSAATDVVLTPDDRRRIKYAHARTRREGAARDVTMAA
ncbi:MAG: tetratricopeptide repeat protein [Vicinamibacterales bacterium]